MLYTVSKVRGVDDWGGRVLKLTEALVLQFNTYIATTIVLQFVNNAPLEPHGKTFNCS